MKIKTDTPYPEFLLALDAFGVTDLQMAEALDAVKSRALKEKLNFDYLRISFGKLATLQQIKNGYDFLTLTFDIILLSDGLVSSLFDEVKGNFFQRIYRNAKIRRTRKVKNKLKTGDALRFIYEVKDKLERITKMFDSIKYVPDEDERNAGIEKTGSSLYNLADWYARRYGITDVEQVYLLPWPRIYAALKIDVEDIEFKKRYQRVLEAKQRRRK